jgi:hypothetical protein
MVRVAVPGVVGVTETVTGLEDPQHPPKLAAIVVEYT